MTSELKMRFLILSAAASGGVTVVNVSNDENFSGRATVTYSASRFRQENETANTMVKIVINKLDLRKLFLLFSGRQPGIKASYLGRYFVDPAYIERRCGPQPALQFTYTADRSVYPLDRDLSGLCGG